MHTCSAFTARSQPWLNMCAIKLRGKIPKSLPQTIVMVNDFVWKPGILTLVLVVLIGLTVAICHKNICILLKNNAMLTSILGQEFSASDHP